MADFVARGIYVGTSNLNNFVQAAPEIMQPYGFAGTIIFTSVGNFTAPTGACAGTPTTPPPCISWQWSWKSSGSYSDSSYIGSAGGSPALPGGYTFNTAIPGQNLIIAEAFYHYTPLLGTTNILPVFTAQTLYKVALYKPRQGTLTTLGN
jgi:hypothetical protein